MNTIVIEANIGERTQDYIEFLFDNIRLNQFYFVDEKTLNTIDIDLTNEQEKLINKLYIIWFIKAKNSIVKVIVRHDLIILTPFTEERSNNLSFYIEIMLCLCENLLIWNISATKS